MSEPSAAITQPFPGNPGESTIRKEYVGPRTGDHTPDGIWIAAGSLIDHLGSKMHVTDLSPWLASLLGTPLAR